MFANRYTAVVDACTLINRYSRHLLLRLSYAELFRIRWSEGILDEVHRNLIALGCEKRNKDSDAVRDEIDSLIRKLRQYYPDAMVEIEQSRLLDLSCVDEKDAHVAAAAVTCNASVIVTENVSDFPLEGCLDPLDIEVKTGDEFIANIIDLDYSKSLPAIREMREDFNNPILTAEGLVAELEKFSLFDTASLLAENMDQI